jgi:HlyD family secretion protein
VQAEGRTRVRDRFVVAAAVSGELQRLQLEPGDPVQAGDTIAQIDPLPLTSQVKATQARLRAAEGELAGVDRQRPKSAALTQAQDRIAATQAVEKQAQARVTQAQAALAQAQRERDRTAALYAQGGISRQDLESQQLTVTQRQQDLEAARQAVTQARAEIAAAKAAWQVLAAEQRDPDYLLQVYQGQIDALEAELVNLADAARRTTLTAPASGQVLTVLEPSRRYVSAGTPLLSLGDPSDLELVADLLSTDAVQVKPGAQVLINRWGGDQVLQGQVKRIEPAAFTQVSALGVEEQRVNVVIELDKPPATLGDGFQVQVEIVVWETSKALQVPISALFRCQNDWCAFVANRGRAQRRQLELGHRSQTAAVVEAGLTAGERVILYPSDQVVPGTRVRGR